ncbi:MAPEG family protein [Legionella sp. W05-934-2]|uniref:MAPEG family protein n=1 Tax=Legionella sp. W05-934-2 TaxID=1198649 RepID=UPI003462BA26
MSPTVLMLMGFITWSIILLLGVSVSRFHAVGSGRFHLRHITPDGEMLAPFAHRIHRAQMNCLENLPMVVGVCLIAFMLNQVQLIDPLAYLFLTCRIAQSLVHLYSVRIYAVMARFLLYAVQIALLIYWLGIMFANS